MAVTMPPIYLDHCPLDWRAIVVLPIEENGRRWVALIEPRDGGAGCANVFVHLGRHNSCEEAQIAVELLLVTKH
jgi:hypothetical protein